MTHATMIQAIVACLALGLLAPSTSLAIPPGGVDTPVHLKRVDAGFLMNAMMERGAHIAFVQLPLAKGSGVTVQQRRADILRISESDRTDAEKDFLGRTDLPANSIIAHRDRQYDFDLPGRLDDPDALATTLNQFIKLDPRYQLVPCGSLTVVVPMDDPILKQIGTLQVTNETADKAIEQLMLVLGPLGIRYVEAIAMPTQNNGKGLYGDTRITLDVEDRPVIELCCRIAEHLGPEYTWSLMTIEGEGRNFGFSNSIR